MSKNQKTALKPSATASRKNDVKLIRNRNQTVLIAKFIEPTAAQLTALGQALHVLINK